MTVSPSSPDFYTESELRPTPPSSPRTPPPSSAADVVEPRTPDIAEPQTPQLADIEPRTPDIAEPQTPQPHIEDDSAELLIKDATGDFAVPSRNPEPTRHPEPPHHSVQLPPIPRLRSVTAPRPRPTIGFIDDNSSNAILRVVNQREKQASRRNISSIKKADRGRKCILCNKYLPTIGHYQTHLKSKNHLRREVNGNGYHCRPCNQKFFSIEDYQRHNQGKRHRNQLLLLKNN